jgi:hypothetical protein
MLRNELFNELRSITHDSVLVLPEPREPVCVGAVELEHLSEHGSIYADRGTLELQVGIGLLLQQISISYPERLRQGRRKLQLDFGRITGPDRLIEAFLERCQDTLRTQELKINIQPSGDLTVIDARCFQVGARVTAQGMSIISEASFEIREYSFAP